MSGATLDEWKSRAEKAEADLAIAVRLLEICDSVLGRYWFEGSYNNEDVISANEKVSAFLCR